MTGRHARLWNLRGGGGSEQEPVRWSKLPNEDARNQTGVSTTRVRKGGWWLGTWWLEGLAARE